MIHSMTGYGVAEQSENGVRYALELRSLNHRYFKVTMKLPESLQYLEADLEKRLRQRLLRGSVTVVLRLKNSSASAAYEINQAALDRYMAQLNDVPVPPGMTPTVDMAALLSMPGVCQPPEQEEDVQERARAVVDGLVSQATEMLVEMRRREGEALRADLLSHCESVRTLAQKIKERTPAVVVEYQEKLRDRVKMLLERAKLEIDKDSLLREVAVYADRCDISEEVTRLSSHLDQFEGMCDSRELTGRKLDFLVQEMLREANTIGSKSNDATIARNVVEIKGGIDRLKEQVQNVA